VTVEYRSLVASVEQQLAAGRVDATEPLLEPMMQLNTREASA